MVINTLGLLNLQAVKDSTGRSGCNTAYESHYIDFVVTSLDGLKTSGTVKDDQYVDFVPQGKPPYSVRVGYNNWSYSTTVDGLSSPDYCISYTTIFPAGPPPYEGNGAHAFVNKLAGSPDLKTE